jgi:hypothetical protein
LSLGFAMFKFLKLRNTRQHSIALGP